MAISGLSSHNARKQKKLHQEIDCELQVQLSDEEDGHQSGRQGLSRTSNLTPFEKLLDKYKRKRKDGIRKAKKDAECGKKRRKIKVHPEVPQDLLEDEFYMDQIKMQR